MLHASHEAGIFQKGKEETSYDNGQKLKDNYDANASKHAVDDEAVHHGLMP